MKKLAILSLVAVLILSGCVEKTDNGDTQSNVVNNTKTDVNHDTISTSTDDKTQIGVSSEDSQIKDDNNVGTESSGIGSEWCIPGSKITVNLPSGQEEFTVAGITTYTDDNGKSYDGLCKAEKAIKGGSSVRYFNKEETIVIAKSESSSKDGSARAEASASVSINK